jgi:ribosomal protein S18 acetylase RimI-like enzyme
MNPAFKIRAAQAGDASFAASMICLSMHGLADHLFQQGADVIEATVAKLFARNAGRFGYRYAYVAESEDGPVGLLIACRGSYLSRLNRATFPHLLAVLGAVRLVGFVWRGVSLPGGKEAYDDEFFISNLGILPSMQGRSFGSQMLAFAEELACENKLKKCSLIVSWHNTEAKRLYERIGYQVVEAVQDDERDLGYYRMVKVL